MQASMRQEVVDGTLRTQGAADRPQTAESGRADPAERSFKRTVSDLERFFPNEEFRTLEEIEGFHHKLSRILDSEFKETEGDLATTYMLLGDEIARIKNQITEIKNVPNVSQAILKEFAQLSTELNNFREANHNYDELERLKAMAADYAKTRDTVTQEQLLTIESAINQNMREISLDILRDATHLPPILRLEKLNKYTFNTPNDGGTGAQYRGLINFDLANMLAAPIPFVVHDSILLKNIDKPVFSEIVRVYEKQKEHGKQVFLVYDTLASYDAGAQRILEKNAVLRLSPAGNELFGWAWNKEEKNDADETS